MYSDLQLQTINRSLQAKIYELESGEAFTKLEKDYNRKISKQEREHKKEVRELTKKHAAEVNQKNKEIKGLQKDLEEANLIISNLKDTVNSLEAQIHSLETTIYMNPKIPDQEEIVRKQREIIEKLKAEIAVLEISSSKKDEIIKIQKAQIEKDYTNSSKPSSTSPNHKKINGRKPSGKKKGGQKGHKGHCRPDLKADVIIDLDCVPEEVDKNPDDYVLLEKRQTRKSIHIEVIRTVTEYRGRVWENKKTGKRVYEKFPPNCTNEINYDESVKAMLLVLTCYMNVSIRKAIQFTESLSDGAISPSAGMVCHLREEFREKSKEERSEIWNNLRRGPYINTDTTFTRINGTTGYFSICTNGKDIFYTAGDHKGARLAEKTPIFGYENATVHDGESEYFNHGTAHQQCLVHLFRHLMGIQQVESDLKWPGLMDGFLHEITSETEKRKVEAGKQGADVQSPGFAIFSEAEISDYRRRYDEILETGRCEYPVKPELFTDGYSTCARLEKQKESVLYFLNHPWIPWHNNMAEKGARTIKRKTKQSDGTKSLKGAENLAAVYTVLESANMKGKNIYETCKIVFAKDPAKNSGKSSRK